MPARQGRPCGEQEIAPVAAEDLGVVVLPGGAAGGAGLGVEVSLAVEAAVLAAGAGDAADLAVLVGGVADPVRTRVLQGAPYNANTGTDPRGAGCWYAAAAGCQDHSSARVQLKLLDGSTMAGTFCCKLCWARSRLVKPCPQCTSGRVSG